MDNSSRYGHAGRLATARPCAGSSDTALRAEPYFRPNSSSSLADRRCLRCGTPITGSPKKRYCSAQCRYAALDEARRIQRRDDALVRERCAAAIEDPWKEGRLPPAITGNALLDGWA